MWILTLLYTQIAEPQTPRVGWDLQSTDPGHSSLDASLCLGVLAIIHTFFTCKWKPRKLCSLEPTRLLPQ